MSKDIGPGLYKLMNDCNIIEPTAEELEKFKDLRKVIQELWDREPPKFTMTFTPASYKLFQDYVTELYKNESKR